MLGFTAAPSVLGPEERGILGGSQVELHGRFSYAIRDDVVAIFSPTETPVNGTGSWSGVEKSRSSASTSL